MPELPPLSPQRVRDLVKQCHDHARSVTDTGRCLRGHPWPCDIREVALAELRDHGQLAALYGTTGSASVWDTGHNEAGRLRTRNAEPGR